MATYVVGDLQGCLTPLLCLLDDIAFNPQQDELWVAGDLVNRGPESLQTLRFLKHLDEEEHCTKIVLGNHDLHLLACAYGKKSPKASDTLSEILTAPDSETLLTWLRHQKLAVSDGKHLMVHAGIAPLWSIEQTLSLANEVENTLQSDAFIPFFEGMYGNSPNIWHDQLTGQDRLRCITNYLTRVRYCFPDGSMDFNEKLAPKRLSLSSPLQPWFRLLKNQNQEQTILFGHWASLMGQCEKDNMYALDTGCVWGGKLTLLRLDDQKIFECHCEH